MHNAFYKTPNFADDANYMCKNEKKNNLDFSIAKEQSAIDIPELPPDNEMIKVMASCHSLTKLNDQLAGDPMVRNLLIS